MIDKETALREFDRFADEWDILTDPSLMTADDLEAFEAHKTSIVSDIMRGKMTVEEDAAVLTFQLRPSERYPDQTIAMDVRRADVLAMDRHKDKEHMHKLVAYIATMTGKPAKLVAGIDPRDMKRLQRVALLFLGS